MHKATASKHITIKALYLWFLKVANAAFLALNNNGKTQSQKF